MMTGPVMVNSPRARVIVELASAGAKSIVSLSDPTSTQEPCAAPVRNDAIALRRLQVLAWKSSSALATVIVAADAALAPSASATAAAKAVFRLWEPRIRASIHTVTGCKRKSTAEPIVAMTYPNGAMNKGPQRKTAAALVSYGSPRR